MSDKKPDAMIGKNLAHFTILEEIGRGGMATVYSAMQKSMGRKIAVKVLPQHFMHNPDFLERFEREVEVISSLEHPHILPIYDYGEDDGVPFIAMRYLGGGSMAQMVRRGIPELDELVKPFHQVADALDYAHQQGIIHRDLKPGNIMLDEHGNAYLSDFGIARVMDSNLTGSGIIGTPAYMSPEQAHGVNIDARSDIYSLGIVLFELITGREPYQAETPMSLLMMQINEPIPPIEDFRPGVPPLIQDVVNTATAKTPDDRYSSASELAKAFEQALKGVRSSTTIIGISTKADHEKTMIHGKTTPLANQGGTFIPDTQAKKPSGALESPLPTEQRDGISDSGSSLMPIMTGIVIILLIAGTAGLYFFTDIFTGETSTLDLPDNFAVIETEDYRIGIPQNMLPSADDFIDESNPDRTYHRWQNTDDVYVTVALVNANRVTQTGYYNLYYEDFLANGDSWQLIEDNIAEDGTLRESYRVENDASLANGQVDVFYMIRGEFLVVVELYTSDAVANGNALIRELQTILDSIQVTGA